MDNADQYEAKFGDVFISRELDVRVMVICREPGEIVDYDYVCWNLKNGMRLSWGLFISQWERVDD